MNTLYVLGAILLISLTAFNTQRHQIDLQRQQMLAEIEMQATHAGTRLLDQLAELPFDPNLDLANPGGLGILTPAVLFGGVADLHAAAFLHDVHGLVLTLNGGGGDVPLTFDAELAVAYVSPGPSGFVATTDQTLFKEVTLQMQGGLGSTITLRRVYSAGV